MPNLHEIRNMADRIRLVPARPEHGRLLHTIFNQDATRKYCPVAGVRESALAARLADSGRNFSRRAEFYRFFGELDETLFGTFIVKNIEWDAAEAEIGFSLLEAHHGQGRGSALVYAGVRKLFAESDINHIWATASVTNTACQALMDKLGFRHCGFYKEKFRILGVPVKQILYRMDYPALPTSS